MNREIFSKKRISIRKSSGKICRAVICLSMILALCLSGCSTPSSSDGNSTANDQSVPESQNTQTQDTSDDETEETDNSDENTGDPSSNEQEDSGDGAFDFNQTLSLKIPEPAAGESPRILFVGNSHTYSNDLPTIFSQMAEAMGHGSDVQELTQGAYTLTEFADPEDELGAVLNQKLTEEQWDFIILQENTNDAFATPQETMLPAASSLDEKIRAAGGQTALLMTWSPKDGASIFSLNDVQTILSQNLIDVSSTLDSLLIPGGVAFMRCMEQYPQIELWAEDGMHPSLEGSYLASCVAYAVIFQESPEGCSYTADLDAETATQLQTLAAGFLAK